MSDNRSLIANQFKLKSYGNSKGVDLKLLVNSLVSVEVTKDLSNDYSDVKLTFEDSALYTNLYNTLFKNGVVSLVEVELFGCGNTATKIISIEGIFSMNIENKLSYSNSYSSEIIVQIKARRIYQYNSEESVKLFPSK